MSNDKGTNIGDAEKEPKRAVKSYARPSLGSHSSPTSQDRGSDGSLRSGAHNQRTIPPNSLTWKYFGDIRLFLAVGVRTSVIEHMLPELGQAVLDHSAVLDKPLGFFERAQRSVKPVFGIVYGEPDAARKTALQVRNVHKTFKGDMPDGNRYHAINPHTFYWAHVTFFEQIYRAAELGVLPRLSEDDKRQIFEESIEWFSLYGVDESSEPASYDEFCAYLDDMFNNQLACTEIARRIMSIDLSPLRSREGIAYLRDLGVPEVVARFVVPPYIPILQWYFRMITLGSMGPKLRQKCDAEWPLRNEIAFRLNCKTLGILYRFTNRVIPYRFFYNAEARAGFERENIDPRKITSRSAREALRSRH